MSNRTKQFSVSVPSDILKAIEKDAKFLAIPKSTVVTMILSSFYHQYESLSAVLMKEGVTDGGKL